MSTVPAVPRPSTAPVAELRERCRGAVHAPGDPGYDAARAAWNVAADQRPAAVVDVADAADVATVVRTCRNAGFHVAPQATGHGAAALGDLSRSVLLRTGALRGVTVDAATRTVRAEAGAQWQDVVGPAAAHGLAVLHGSAPDVGVVGYTLGGGLGWYARRLGLAANHVTAVELVTGTGTPVRVDATHDPELFWALRGGGGSFGVVTAIEFAAHPITTAYAGWLVWPWERAAAVLPAWEAWTRDLPDSVTSLARLLQLPPSPDVPEPLRGRSLVVVEAAMLEAAERGVQLLAPLRALAPELDTFATVPQTALPDLHRDPPHAVPFAGDHVVLDRLPQAAITAVLDTAGPGTGSRLLHVELRQLGGALAVPSAGGGARAHLAGAFAVHAVGVTPTPYDGELVVAQAGAVVRALAPWASPVGYANFDETGDAIVHDGDVAARLAAVARRTDPCGVIRSKVRVPR